MLLCAHVDIILTYSEIIKSSEILTNNENNDFGGVGAYFGK